MIASFMNDTAGDVRDRNALTRRLFSCGSLVDNVSDTDTGFRGLCDHVFTQIGTGSTDASVRAGGYLLLNTIISAFSRKTDKFLSDGRLSGFLDRLPTLFESLGEVEVEPLVSLFETLLSVDILSPVFLRMLPKLISRISRIMRTSGENGSGMIGVSRLRVQVGLSLLVAIARSSFQNLLLPASSSLQATCIDAFDIASVACKAAELLGLLLSLESTEAWTGAWLVLTEQLASLLHDYLGVTTGYLVDIAHFADLSEVARERVTFLQGSFRTLSGQIRSTASDSDGTPGGGCSQALHVEVVFRSCCAALQHMLRCGCSGGGAALDLSALTAVTSSVLSLRLTSQSSDPKALLHNAAGVALIDISVVAPQLKIAVLELCSEMFTYQHPALFKVASVLCRPLAALLGSSELKAISSQIGNTSGQGSLQLRPHAGVARAAMRAVGCAAACAPTALISAAGGAAMQALMEVFEVEVEFMCTPTTAVMNTASTHPAGSEAVLTTIEQMVLFVGPLMPASCQETIELQTGKALRCMSQGVLLRTVPSKHLHREASAPLRHSPRLQELCLRIATAEVAYCHHHGLRSGNAGLLLQTAQACIRQGLTHEGGVAMQAARALSLLETLLNPSVPPLAPREAYDTSNAASSSQNLFATSSKDQILPDKRALLDSGIQRQTLNTGSARGREDTEDSGDQRNKRARQDTSDEPLVTDNFDKNSGSEEEDESEGVWNPGTANDSTHNAAVPDSSAESASDNEDSEDEDFELPDIDTGADPDRK